MCRKLTFLVLIILLLAQANSASAADLIVPSGSTMTKNTTESFGYFMVAGRLTVENGANLTFTSESHLDGVETSGIRPEIIINGGSFYIDARTNMGTVKVGNGGNYAYLTMNGGTFTCTDTFKFPDDSGGEHRIYLNDGIMHCGDIEQKHDRDAIMYVGGGILRLDDTTGGNRDPQEWKANGDLLPAEGYDEVVIEYIPAGPYTEVRAIRYDVNVASNPGPADGAVFVPVDANLSWTPGCVASSHDVYVGTDFNDVNDANSTYYPNVDYNNIDVNNYRPGLLAFSTTYYWRVDEVNDAYPGSVWVGKVWCFEVEDGKASNPSPADRMVWQPVDVNLIWTPGALATSHDVYIGTDFDDVNDANSTYHPNVDYNNVDVNNYSPGLLALGTTYYWRVDEVSATTYVKGDIWRFTTLGILHLKVDLAMVDCPDTGTIRPETAKPGWWHWAAPGWADMYAHDLRWEDGGDTKPTDSGIDGSGVHAAVTLILEGDLGLKASGLTGALGGGVCPTDSTVHEPICNTWLQCVDWPEFEWGSIQLVFHDLPAGEYELYSYHNHFGCYRGDEGEYTPVTCDCLCNPAPPMPEIRAMSCKEARELPYQATDPWSKLFPGIDWTTGPWPEGVTSIQEAYNVQPQQVTTDAELVPSLIKFSTDGSPVLILYKAGCCEPDPVRPTRVGGRGILNAFELILKSSPCGLFRDNIVDYLDLSVLSNNWLWSDQPGVINIADFDEDGLVNFHDFAYLAIEWLENCP